MGWDDNGLPTERRVQNYYGVRCDPTLPVRPGLRAAGEAGRSREIPIRRRNFVELCDRLAVEDEQTFEELWRRLGLSVDWAMTYTTIGEASRRASQRAFLRNLARGEAYQAEAPTLWDVDFRTAVAQAELEDREHAGRVPHAARSTAPTAQADIVIETTRPELLPGVRRARRPPRRRALPRPLRHDGDARRCSASGAGASRTRSPTPRRAPASR